jgi:hypothetical protein
VPNSSVSTLALRVTNAVTPTPRPLASSGATRPRIQPSASSILIGEYAFCDRSTAAAFFATVREASSCSRSTGHRIVARRYQGMTIKRREPQVRTARSELKRHYD